MYAWYLHSGLCYAYLADVDSEEDPKAGGSSFRKSAWFTRGWTLQELLAPSVIYFFGSDWAKIGSRASLKDVIAEVTSIGVDYFVHGKLSHFSTAQKMSWAARRRTTRVEDMAYSLMGIFNVSMPLLYGEGLKAFQRLQQRILRQCDDYSIFANGTPWHPTGFLATRPSDFRNSGRLKKSSWEGFEGWNRGATLTNRGIEITLPIASFNDFGDLPTELISKYKDVKMAILNCELDGCAAVIFLQEKGTGAYERARPYRTITTEASEAGFTDLEPFSLLNTAHLEKAKVKMQNILLLHETHNPIVRIRRFSLQFSYPEPSVSGFTPSWFTSSLGTWEPAPLQGPRSKPTDFRQAPSGSQGWVQRIAGGGSKFVHFVNSDGRGFVLGLSSNWRDNGWTHVCLELYPNPSTAKLSPTWKDEIGDPVSGSEHVEATQEEPGGELVIQVHARKFGKDWNVELTISRRVISQVANDPVLIAGS